MYADYLILTPGYSYEQLKAYKSLEGYNHFVNGWVTNIAVTELSTLTKSFLFTALVRHSQRLSLPPLKVWVAIKQTGEVICAHCTCMAGLGEACSHIAAVLFTAEANTQTKHQLSSTSLPCSWLPASYQFVSFSKVANIDFTTPSQKRKTLQRKTEDEHSSSTPSKKVYTVSQPTQDEIQQLYVNLSKIDRKPVLLSHTEGFSDPFIPASELPNFPKPLSELFDENATTMSYPDLLQRCDEVYNSYFITVDQAELVGKHTKQQANSQVWFQQRSGRLTASRLKSAINTDISQPSPSLIKSICYPDTYKFVSTACSYGCRHEEVVRKEYMYEMSKKHESFTLSEAGLHLDPLHPFLGATPDGLVNCSCCGNGVLEVKCPYSCRERGFQQAVEEDTSFFIPR